jgi:hypothetical protein
MLLLLTLNVAKCYKPDIIYRNDSYKILTPDENLDSFKGEFIVLSQARKYFSTYICNSEARFVVAGANKFTTSKKVKILFSISL